ncbi:MAG: nucleotide sugar dehydrogenase [Candidatus Rokuibacteriota bacterium]
MSDTRIAIVGQGYVGLPLSVAAAQAGLTVVGIDRSEDRVATLSKGESPVGDVKDAELGAIIEDGRYRATTSFEAVADCHVIVLCVPTPYHNDAPDLSYIEAAGEQVGRHLTRGALVILESTTYPGTTEELLQPLLERESGLVAGEDFDLAFSPERIDPGNAKFDIHNTPKIVGGTSPRATERAASFYGRFVERIHEVSGPTSAEMAKLLENTFRHINIALVNELAIICRDLNVDVWEVIDAAASKPFGFMPFYPGPGVGGHCIPVDPMYLSWRARQFGGSAKFIELARDVNAAMPHYCVSRVQDLLNNVGKALCGARILVLGVAYKPNIADLRESPALPFIERLRTKGAAVRYHDPHVPVLALSEDESLETVDLTEDEVSAADCVVILTHHDDVDYARVSSQAGLVFDTRNVGLAGLPNVHRL